MGLSLKRKGLSGGPNKLPKDQLSHEELGDYVAQGRKGFRVF